jgi:hypothetical protein
VRRRYRSGWIFGLLPALTLSAGAALVVTPASAQEITDARFDPYPVNALVGLVTKAQGATAWIQMPSPVPVGAKIEFATASDGTDALYVGTARWTAPTAPYETYVTDIRAVSRKYPANEYDTLLGVEISLNLRRVSKIRPQNDPNGVALAIGFAARTPLPTAPPPTEAVEPVRAHIRALRALKTKTADAIAAAAEKSLPDPDADDLQAQEEINYVQLVESLRRFRRLQIADPITEKLLGRLLLLANESGRIGSAVPADLLRPASELQNTGPGVPGGLRR